MDSVGGYAASGGIPGAISASLYIAYKCCYRKKFKSKCCGAEMDIETDNKAPSEAEEKSPT